ncbi:TlpA disulfide reductase family protein [Pedobacter frigoris]|uniref:TlpA disulfide reductase family protein n=1 Tax=Pedobacter frigoris TaxID=2571272 RepID=UPI00292D3770|nr:TlpA disulfide reductase family protein [Pedobacter frigoris]
MKKIRIFLLLTFLLIGKASFAEFNYRISGKFESVENGTKLYLYVTSDNKRIDSAIYDNGFVMEGTSTELLMCSIIDAKFRRMAYFVLEEGRINIQGKKNILDFTVKGGKQNGLLSHGRSFFSMSDQLKEETYLKKSNELIKINDVRWKLYNDSANYIGDSYSKKLDSFYRYHPESFHALANIWGMIGSRRTEETERRYEHVSAELKMHRYGRYIRDYLKSTRLDKAIDIQQKDTLGITRTISFPNENYVLLDFWASWCGPCRLNNPKLRELNQLYSNKNFSLVSISLDDNLNNWKKAIAEDEMSWLNISDLKGWNNEYSAKYGFRAIPFYVIISPEGKILMTTTNEIEKIEGKLKEIFNDRK